MCTKIESKGRMALLFVLLFFFLLHTSLVSFSMRSQAWKWCHRNYCHCQSTIQPWNLLSDGKKNSSRIYVSKERKRSTLTGTVASTWRAFNRYFSNKKSIFLDVLTRCLWKKSVSRKMLTVVSILSVWPWAAQLTNKQIEQTQIEIEIEIAI